MVVLKRLMAVAVLVGSMALAAVGASAADCGTARQASTGTTPSANCQVSVSVTTLTFANVQGIGGVANWAFTLSGAVDGDNYLYDAGDISTKNYGFEVKSNDENLHVNFTGGTMTWTGGGVFCPVYKFSYGGNSYYYRASDPDVACSNGDLGPSTWTPIASSGVSVGEGDNGIAKLDLEGFAIEVANPNDLPTSGAPAGTLTVTISSSAS